MKIELGDKVIRGLYFLGMITHSSNIHKEHHISYIKCDDDNEAEFYCIDCEEKFWSKMIEV